MAYRTDLMKFVMRRIGQGSEEEGIAAFKAILKQDYDEERGMYSYKATAEKLRMYGLEVSRQHVRYWASIVEISKAKADRETVVNVEMKPVPSCVDERCNPDLDGTTILFLTDLHTPYHHPDAFDFLSYVADKYNPTVVINGGDECDKHAMSFHDSDPNLDSAGMELKAARKALGTLANMFPDMYICDSNHGSMAYRRAHKSGIPVEYIKDYIDVLFPGCDKPNWKWADDWMVNTRMGPVLFRHQYQGKSITAACNEGMSVALGHLHTKFELEWKQTRVRRFFGLTGGCLIDPVALAYKYAKTFKDRPMLGCTIIHKGVPLLLPMILNTDNRWVRRLHV